MRIVLLVLSLFGGTLLSAQADSTKTVERMPVWAECATLQDSLQRTECGNERMLRFIYSNINYPARARENGIEGIAVVQFVIERDGSMSEMMILKNPGGGTGEEALRVISMLPDWSPGTMEGEPVRVQMAIPVKFRLERKRRSRKNKN